MNVKIPVSSERINTWPKAPASAQWTIFTPLPSVKLYQRPQENMVQSYYREKGFPQTHFLPLLDLATQTKLNGLLPINSLKKKKKKKKSSHIPSATETTPTSRPFPKLNRQNGSHVKKKTNKQRQKKVSPTWPHTLRPATHFSISGHRHTLPSSHQVHSHHLTTRKWSATPTQKWQLHLIFKVTLRTSATQETHCKISLRPGLDWFFFFSQIQIWDRKTQFPVQTRAVALLLEGSTTAQTDFSLHSTTGLGSQ